MTYLLLILVLALWAAVFRKVFSHLSRPDPVPAAERPTGERKLPPARPELRLDYRDPFLEEEKPRAPTPSRRVASSEPQPQPETPSEEPPPLQFKGVIRQGKALYAMISVGATTGIVAPGDSVGGYRVRSVAADSVQVQKGRKIYSLHPQ